MMKISKRLQALKLGMSKYSTGRPCLRGHNAFRYSKTGHCSECLKNKSRIYAQNAKAYLSPMNKLITLEFKIHKDDEERIRKHVEAINAARQIEQQAEIERVQAEINKRQKIVELS